MIQIHLRISLVCILTILIVQISHGQVKTNRLLPLGIKAGTNYTNAYDLTNEHYRSDAKSGFTAGVFLPISLGRTLGIQPEILFSQKGIRASGNLLGSTFTMKRTTGYLDVPVMVAFKPMQMVSFFGGVQFSYLLTERDQWVSSAASDLQMRALATNEGRKKIVGLVVGLDVNADHFVLGVRGGWDLQSNLLKPLPEKLDYKNTCLQTTLGYRF